MWKDIFGFLDGLKGDMKKAGSPDQLADLMARWQVYEMTRGNADVTRFARDLLEDPSVATMLDKAIKSNANWLRDSAGLWCRFHAMVLAGDVKVDDAAAAERLARAVESALDQFDKTAGGAAPHGGAMYAQVVTALLCANASEMETSELILMCQRVGKALVNKWKAHASEVANHCPAAYVVGASRQIWGDPQADPVLTSIFPKHIAEA